MTMRSGGFSFGALPICTSRIVTTAYKRPRSSVDRHWVCCRQRDHFRTAALFVRRWKSDARQQLLPPPANGLRRHGNLVRHRGIFRAGSGGVEGAVHFLQDVPVFSQNVCFLVAAIADRDGLVGIAGRVGVNHLEFFL